jgi:hypothetical protein
VKLFVNNPELWNPFLKELESRIADCARRLEQVSDPVEIYRTQGEVQALRKLQQLRDKVNAK